MRKINESNKNYTIRKSNHLVLWPPSINVGRHIWTTHIVEPLESILLRIKNVIDKKVEGEFLLSVAVYGKKTRFWSVSWIHFRGLWINKLLYRIFKLYCNQTTFNSNTVTATSHTSTSFFSLILFFDCWLILDQLQS